MLSSELWYQIQIEAMCVRGVTESDVLKPDQKTMVLRATAKKLVELASHVELLAESSELDAILDVPFVFWQCKDHKEQNVTWEHTAKDPGGATSIATCQICGKTSR